MSASQSAPGARARLGVCSTGLRCTRFRSLSRRRAGGRVEAAGSWIQGMFQSVMVEDDSGDVDFTFEDVKYLDASAGYWRVSDLIEKERPDHRVNG